MALSDYYKNLTKRVVTQNSDGGGSFTESTPTDSTIRGYIALLSNWEQNASAQNKVFAIAKLFTTETLDVKNRIVDGSTVYEIVGAYDFFHKYYDLKKIN